MSLQITFFLGLTDGPRLNSGRITFIFLFIWGLLLYQFYSASIVGSLLGEPTRYINTLKDLLDSDLRVGIEDIAYNYDYFAVSITKSCSESESVIEGLKNLLY